VVGRTANAAALIPLAADCTARPGPSRCWPRPAVVPRPQPTAHSRPLGCARFQRKIAKRILAEAGPARRADRGLSQLATWVGMVQASVIGFPDPCGEPVQGHPTPRLTIYAQALQNVLGSGRGQGLAVIVIGAGRGCWAGHLACRMVPPGDWNAGLPGGLSAGSRQWRARSTLNC